MINPPDIAKFKRDPASFIGSLRIPSAHGTRVFRDVMAGYQKQWFKSIAPSLLAVAAGKAPPIGRFWCERTKGASKDSDIALCLLWLLAFSPRKLDMLVGASDRDQANELRKAAVDCLALNPWLGERIESLNWVLRCSATGSECTIVASDVSGSHGSRCDVSVLNELSHISKEEFAQNVLDNASKKPQGLVIVASNAGFKGSWQESWRTMARDSDRWSFHTYSQPAPWLVESELEEAERRNSKARYRRLFWGEWVSQSGDALDQADIDACVSEPGPSGRRAGWAYVAGVDLGVRHDHSAFVVIGCAPHTQELVLAYAESWSPNPKTGKVDLMQVEHTILAMNKRYAFRTVGFDPSQAYLLMQRLQQQKVRVQEVTFTGKNLTDMASTMLDVFRSRRLRLYNHPALIRDLSKLTIDERAFGSFKLSAVSDSTGHADLAIALSIALPIAVAQAGRREILVGPTLRLDQGEYTSPFAMKSEFDLIRQHEEMLAEAGSDPAGTEEWRRFMRAVGRIS